MINLLPPDLKQSYVYGGRNTTLLRWTGLLVTVIIGLGLLATYGLLTIQHSSDSYAGQVATAQGNLNKQNLVGTEKQVKQISTDFRLVVQVLSKEVLFSKLLKQIATVIPPDTVLTGLDINQTTGGIDLSAAASDYNTATQVQINLQDPANKIFSKADIVSITCNADSNDPAHPCKIQLRALFASNNPYLFINSKAGA